MTEPTDDEIKDLYAQETGFILDDSPAALLDFARAVLAKWGTPQQEAQEPCPACIALARTVMLDQVSFDRKPDCYGIRQITDDEGIEEWADIRTSPDVAREEANDMMATGRGEIYEVVPLWTTPQPAPATQQAWWTNADSDAARLALELECLLMDTKDTAVVSKWWQSANEALELHRARLQEAQPSPTAQAAESVPAREHDLQDVRCECCGYMTYHREHMGCIRAARAPSDSVLEDAADPLQGAANWLAEAHGQFSPVVLSGCLMIGYNRAKRLHDAALAARKQGANHD